MNIESHETQKRRVSGASGEADEGTRTPDPFITSEVLYQLRFDRVTGAGIAPLPLQRPIPLWFGGGSKPAYRRMGRLADGWLPMMTPGPELDEAMATIAASAEAAGRDPQTIGMEGRITWGGDIDQVRVEADQWRALGATHIAINTMGSGLGPVAAHLEVLAQVATALEL